jgi:hypothetical protein
MKFMMNGFGMSKRQRMSLKNPPQSVEGLLAAYERQGLAQTAAKLRAYDELL